MLDDDLSALLDLSDLSSVSQARAKLLQALSFPIQFDSVKGANVTEVAERVAT